MVPYLQIDKDAGVAAAFSQANLDWAGFIISAGALAGLTSVLLVMMMSAPRVFLAMARDGLLPSRFFAAVHPRFQTPWKSSIVVGLFVAVLAGFLPIDALLHMTNIGTLFAFAIVCAAVLVMRRTNPNAHRPFRVPFSPIIPLLGIGGCLLLMFSLPPENWWRLLAWLAVGFVIYFLYGRFHSRLGKHLEEEIRLQGLSPAGSPADPTEKQ
jgi:APA family basic amino acid/polyamine antiporter